MMKKIILTILVFTLVLPYPTYALRPMAQKYKLSHKKIQISTEKAKQFLSELDIGKEDLAKAILRFPPLAGYSVLKNLKPKMVILQQMNIPDNKRIDALIKLATKNVTLVEIIWHMASQRRIEPLSLSSLISTYDRLNRYIKGKTAKTAASLIKEDKKHRELIIPIVEQILSGKTAYEIDFPQELIMMPHPVYGIKSETYLEIQSAA